MNLPRTLGLYLKSHQKRKDITDSCLKESNINVEWINGIDAKGFGLNSNIPNLIDQQGVLPQYINPYFMSQGHLGCYLSHYLIWNIIQFLPEEEFLIVEDDVYPVHEWESLYENFYNALPNDWEYVYLGYCCEPEKDKIKIVNEHVRSGIISPLCTHAYMIKKSTAEMLIDSCNKPWAHVDIIIRFANIKLNWYMPNKEIFCQRSNNKAAAGTDFISLTHTY